MNTTTKNTLLLTIGTGLIALGATSIATNLLEGAIEIILGIAVYIVYEVTP